MKKIIFILSVLFLSINAFSQVDKEFWFAAPDLSSNHFETCVKLRFVTFDQATTVTVTQPANPSFPKQTITIGPNSSSTLQLGTNTAFSLSAIETTTGNGNAIDKTGLLITSDNPIEAYYANTCDNSEIYALKGKNALGLDFIVPTQYDYTNSSGYNGGNSVEIVASQDGTSIDITPSQACVGHTKNVKFTITLNKGESFALRASGLTGADHLFNTRITSTKPIAVNYTDDSVSGPGVDLIGDQLVPITQAGTKYIAIKNAGLVEKVYIFPTQNNTTVYIKGVAQPVMNIGDKKMIDLTLSTDLATYINSNYPIVVLQITSNTSGSELGGAILPKLECTGSMEIGYVPAFNSDVNVAIITKTENIGNFFVNGVKNFRLDVGLFHTVPNTNSVWSYIITKLSGTVLKITNSSGYFHMGAFDAVGNTCGLGWFSNYNVTPVQTITDKNYYLDGDQLKLFVAGSSAFSSISLKGPLPTTSNTKTYSSINDTIIIPHITAANAGMYEISAIHVDGCNTIPDTIMLSVFKAEKNTGISICKGNSTTLTASGYDPYVWAPGGSTSKGITVNPLEDTQYTVINYKQGQSLLQNGNFETGNTKFSSDYSFTSTAGSAIGKYTVGLTPQAINPAFDAINDHTSGSGKQLVVNCDATAGAKIWTKTIDVSQLTNYVLSAWFVNAAAAGTPAKLQYSINGTLIGSMITPTGQWSKSETTWSSGAKTSATISIVSTSTAGAGVGIDDISFAPLFAVKDTFAVAVADSLHPVISGDVIVNQEAYICHGASNLNVNGVYDSYQWFNRTTNQQIQGATNKTITLTVPGNYSVRVTEGDCKGTGYITVKKSDPAEFTLNAIPQICSGEPNFSIVYTPTKGDVGSYKVAFDSNTKIAGFKDTLRTVTGNLFDIELPTNVRPDIYHAILTAYEKNCADSTLLPIEFKVKYKSDVLTQRWNDVIGVKNSKFNGDTTNTIYNGGYTFTAYQWYKNGEILAGETKSYLYQGGNNMQLDSTASYSVLLTRNDGVSILTCDFSPKLFTDADIIVPTLVSPSQVMSIKKVTASGQATIWNITGRMESQQFIDANNSNVQAPAQKGMYVLRITTGKEYKQYKIVVR